MGYLYPVPFTRSTSWSVHKLRIPPSQEPGIDLFCPIGTPVVAAGAGRVVDTGDSIVPATGRFVTIDLDDGRRVRYLHLSRRVVNVGARVSRGDVIAYSGATGYGEADWSWNVAETGGAHVHMTLWPSWRYVFGGSGTLDPELYFDRGAYVAGGNSKPFEEDDMTPDQATQLARVDAFIQALGGVDFAKKLVAVELFNGVEGVDLSTPRLRLALDGAIDMRDRYVIDANGDGAKDFDLMQLTRNEVQPKLQDIENAIDLDALADKIAERLSRGRTA